MDTDTIICQYSEGVRYFFSVDLMEENLSGVDLQGVNLSGSILQGANLSGADLSGANLSESCLDDTNLAAANLEGVRGSFTYGGAFFCKTISPEGEVITGPMWQD
ncbi:MAG: pentapeptide repeat-containing protein [Cyanobacteria bacterium P01_G01_bin.49]